AALGLAAHPVRDLLRVDCAAASSPARPACVGAVLRTVGCALGAVLARLHRAVLLAGVPTHPPGARIARSASRVVAKASDFRCRLMSPGGFVGTNRTSSRDPNAAPCVRPALVPTTRR